MLYQWEKPKARTAVAQLPVFGSRGEGCYRKNIEYMRFKPRKPFMISNQTPNPVIASQGRITRSIRAFIPQICFSGDMDFQIVELL